MLTGIEAGVRHFENNNEGCIKIKKTAEEKVPYYLRVVKIERGEIKRCHCMIKVKGNHDIYAVWRSNKKPHQDISIEVLCCIIYSSVNRV